MKALEGGSRPTVPRTYRPLRAPSRSSACRATHTDKLTVRPAWLMARLMARVLISDADGRRSRRKIAPNSYVWQRFSRLERVTGIEPALSAWEEFLSHRLSVSCHDIGGLNGPMVAPTGLALWPVCGPILSVRAMRPARPGRSCCWRSRTLRRAVRDTVSSLGAQDCREK